MSDPAELALSNLERMLAREPALRDLMAPAGVKTDKPGRFVPQADVVQGERSYTVLVDLPGVRRADVDVTLEGARLIVRGVRRPSHPHGKARSVERGAGRFERVFLLPSSAVGDAVTADLIDGVLRIEVPVAGSAVSGRRIEVSGGS
jgi:HSP20 family protein